MTAVGRVTRTCAQCGFSGSYRSPAVANDLFGRHSCARHQRREAMAARAPHRPRRDCHHPGRPHVHGTRTAYVRDRCRCAECRAANAVASRKRDRDLAYARWRPWADAAPVRTHILTLADAGIGRLQLAHLSGVNPRHIGALVHGRRGRLQTRVRGETAQRILAVTPEQSNRAPNSPVDGTGTRRRLQALVALGWPMAWLADLLDRDATNLGRAVYSGQVTASTAEDVTALYERLWNTRPPSSTPRQRRAVSEALRRAARNGWLTPLAWDDPDNDPEPPGGGASNDGDAIDEIAIERALTGHGIQFRDLRRDEQAEVVRRFTTSGKSIRDIADALKISSRTVSRRRRRSAA